MEDLIDITLDPYRLPDVSQEDLIQYLQYYQGESYANTINMKEVNSDNKLRNKNFFKRNNIINFPYEKNRNTNNNDLDISVFLLMHGGNNSFGSIIKKKHNFWKNNTSNIMFNCNGENIVGIKANSVRMYNDIGFNVTINDNIYKVLIGVFYFNSMVCLILLYLILNLFRSRINNKIYPYKKLYTIGKQKIVIANPLKNINNNSNVENNEKVIKDDNFHYYVPNISLGLKGTKQKIRKGENYVCFVIRHNGILKMYKFVLTYENFEKILKYKNINSINLKDLLNRLNLADLLNIIYNTIENKILPKYPISSNIHINFDLMFCKGELIPNDFILTKKVNNKCYKLANEFGYSYIGHYKNCLSDLCVEIRKIGLKEKKIDIEEYFQQILKINFEENESTQSTNQFIEDLISTEKKLGYFNLKLKNIFEIIQKLKSNDFSQNGSGKKKIKKKIKKRLKKN